MTRLNVLTKVSFTNYTIGLSDTLYGTAPMFYQTRVIVICTILLLTACRPAPTGAPPTIYVIPTSNTDLLPTPTTTPCDFLLLPLRDRAAWQYRLTAPDGSE